MDYQPALPTIIEATDDKTSQDLLHGEALQIIVSRRGGADDVLRRWAEVEVVFTDADGTVVPEGSVEFPAEYADYIKRLSQKGVAVVLVTGKPLVEVRQLRASMPPRVSMNVICEKGAYYAEFNLDGTVKKHYLLSSSEAEAAVAALRREFETVAEPELIKKYRDSAGNPQVSFGWSGSGEHLSVLSVDIFAGAVDKTSYLSLTGEARDRLKLKNSKLLRSVETDIEAFVAKRHPDWRVVHLGNGNTEISPSSIEKDAAIRQMPEFTNAKRVLVWGDSANDLAMFRLRRQYDKVESGLVAYREAALRLVPEVDFVSFGMANTRPYFQLLLAARA